MNKRSVDTKKKLVLLVAFISTSLFFIQLIKSDGFYREVLIADNGNFLFYNSPVAAKYKNGFVVGYLTNKGDVYLDYLVEGKAKKSLLVHSYGKVINSDIGLADDHAAPAVIYDSENDRVLVATSYHGAPLYIYEVYLESSLLKIVKEISGRYTYPRFLKNDGEIILTVRNQSRKKEGDFVYLTSSDHFLTENILIPSGRNSVIYAGIPDVSGNKIVFSYSTHSYEENRLLGLNLATYDLSKKKIIKNCDLSAFLDDYFSNRPTGLRVKDGQTIFATSFFSLPTTYESAESHNFSQKQKVKILQGNSEICSSIRVSAEYDSVSMPYYDVSVTISESGKYLLFDNNRVLTNSTMLGCFYHEKMIYPNFIDGVGLLYATMNGSYSIRNFDTSIYGCIE